MNEEFDQQIKAAVVPPPMDENLTRRLRVMARKISPRKPWWQSKLMPTAAVVTLVGVVAFATMVPAKASAKTYDLIVAAAQQVKAFQFSVVSYEDGSRQKREHVTIAGADGKVFMRATSDVVGGHNEAAMEIAGDSMSIYVPEEKKIMRLKFGGLVPAEMIAKEVQSGIAEGMKAMDLKKMLAEYRQKYGQEGIRISGVTREGGRSVYHVYLAAKSEPERVDLTVDAATDLPEQVLVESQKDSGRWQAEAMIQMRFGNRVDSSLLRSSIPTGVKVEELDLNSIVGDAMKGIEKFGKGFEAKP